MIEFLHSPFQSTFKAFADSIRIDCLICSPYITLGPVRMLSKTIIDNKLADDIRINVLTDISLRNLIQGSTEIPALLYLAERHRNVTITYLPRIHAKVYISNGTTAIITSANFTDGGEAKNFEYGVKVDDATLVQKIQTDIYKYRALGANVTKNQLEEVQRQVEQTRESIQSEQKAISQKLRLESKKQERMIEDNLIRIRVKNKSANSIFSETLLYLLSQRPMPTNELHLLIQDINPDLCDDHIDRVIDGKHFGKLWKHQVRNAQVYLRRIGQVFYDEKSGLWHKV